MTFPYYRFYRQNTLLPIVRLAESVRDRDSADSISQRLHQWQTRKLDEYRFVQLSVCGPGKNVSECYAFLIIASREACLRPR